SNPTALNQTVKYAYDKGVPEFSMVGYVTSPYAVNSSTNFVVTGKKMGEWMVDQMGKKGNVLVVEGIPGTSTSDSLDRGMKLGLATAPNVKIVGDVAGMWTDQVAQAEVQKWLANHPGELDGVIVQSAAEMGVLRALEQSGPKMQSVLADSTRLSYDDIKATLPENCSEDSSKWYTVGPEKYGSTKGLDGFFLRPADPEAYKAK